MRSEDERHLMVEMQDGMQTPYEKSPERTELLHVLNRDLGSAGIPGAFDAYATYIEHRSDSGR